MIELRDYQRDALAFAGPIREHLRRVRELLGCTRMEAANWWIELLKVVLPHIHEEYAAQPETG
jgi:hypothetical protein